MENIFITGGAGFIGANAAKWFIERGARVTIFDNLSREGSEKNLEWLRIAAPSATFIKGDVRNIDELTDIFNKHEFDFVLHCAAQVAVTTSVTNPLHDRDVNVVGTVNMLEAVRNSNNPHATFLYTSTNKVYGGLEHIGTLEKETRYELMDKPNGIDETAQLDFHSPYGCSKGAADQYVRDYARIYGMNTIVFRQSCIYGPRQMGMEDQGWVVWIVSRALLGHPARVYGTGKQIRDLLYIEDLLNAYESAARQIQTTRGRIYNIGGGPHMAMSVMELLSWLKERYPDFRWDYFDWRPGDQKVYISDVHMAERDFGWKPTTTIEEGLGNLTSWVNNNKELFTIG